MTERRTPPEPVALLLGLAGPPPGVERIPPEAAGAPSSPRRSARPEIDARVEAVLMAADAPLALAELAAAVDRPVVVARQAVERLQADYDGLAAGPRRGFELREVATGWRLYARAEHDGAVGALAEAEHAGRLSRAALETLAVIAYRQPVTRAQVAAIRAVSVDSVLRTLQARGLVAEAGRSAETGATLFATTDELLVALGIPSIDALPPIAPLLEGAEAADAR